MPKKPLQNRDHLFQVKLLPDERDRWGRAATLEGLSISAWVRQLANREARRVSGDQAALGEGSGEAG